MRKARHLIEAFQHNTVVFIDHAANASITKQTILTSNNTDKLNLRLIRVSTYLFQFRLDIRYRFDKRHVLPNALFKLSADRSFLNDDENLNLKSYHVSMKDPSTNDQQSAYYEALMKMSKIFRKRLTKEYAKEKAWTRLIEMLIGLSKHLELEKPSPESEASFSPPVTEAGSNRQPVKKTYIEVEFELKDGLIYSLAGGRRRLCIPATCEQKVFRMTHDDNQHADRHRCYQRIADALYVPRLSRKLRQYLRHCPACQLNQIKRHRSYDELMLISDSPRSFHTLTLNFVMALSDLYDALLTVTNKFFRRITLLYDKTIYGVAD